jgi:HTH-type transcriptional regulator, glycine betaine synthesis regulator
MKSANGGSQSAPGLKTAEVPLIDICVRIAQFIGLPKSVGEIYGLLFVSLEPVPLDGVIERLNLSKGSASQGLKQLRAYGAIKPSYVPGDRRDHYVAETDLKKLLEGFLRERIEPGVIDLAERLVRLQEDFAKMPARERAVAQERVDTLRLWQRQAQRVLPLVNGFLGK